MRIVVVHRKEEDCWVAEVPSLPGCMLRARSKMEVVQNIQEAIHQWIESAQLHAEPIPAEDFEIEVIC